MRHQGIPFPLETTEPPARRITLGRAVLAVGCGAIIIPTMVGVARYSWSTEQGGHGPLVLASGLWLMWREASTSRAIREPGSFGGGMAFTLVMLLLFLLAHITGILQIEGFVMYGALLGAVYLLVGGRFLRTIWFPLVYLAFALPPPESVVALVTQPLKIGISTNAVSLLHALGYPVASSGVQIQIAQYELLVAAACAGMNSIVTLSALCLFYVYLRHRSSPLTFLLVCVAVIPVAVFSNFVRVITLILVTYYLGESAAQGFLHEFAGLTLFAVALLTLFALDSLATRFLRRRSEEIQHD